MDCATAPELLADIGMALTVGPSFLLGLAVFLLSNRWMESWVDRAYPGQDNENRYGVYGIVVFILFLATFGISSWLLMEQPYMDRFFCAPTDGDLGAIGGLFDAHLRAPFPAH